MKMGMIIITAKMGLAAPKTLGVPSCGGSLQVPGCRPAARRGAAGERLLLVHRRGRLVRLGRRRDRRGGRGERVRGRHPAGRREYVQVSAIMSNPNTDPHTFEASASVARLVSSAQLVVQNGVGYDRFMTTIENAAPSSSRKVIVVQDLLGLPTDTPNPHLWYKPVTMPAVANAVAADLAALHRPTPRTSGPTRPPSSVAGRVGQRDRRVQGEVPEYAGRDDRAGGGLHAPGDRRREPDAVGVPGRHHDWRRPVAAGRRDPTEPLHPAQGEGRFSTTSR